MTPHRRSCSGLDNILHALHLSSTTSPPETFDTQVKQWDYSFDSTGDGDALLTQYPDSTWAKFSGLKEPIQAVWSLTPLMPVL